MENNKKQLAKKAFAALILAASLPVAGEAAGFETTGTLLARGGCAPIDKGGCGAAQSTPSNGAQNPNDVNGTKPANPANSGNAANPGNNGGKGGACGAYNGGGNRCNSYYNNGGSSCRSYNNNNGNRAGCNNYYNSNSNRGRSSCGAATSADGKPVPVTPNNSSNSSNYYIESDNSAVPAQRGSNNPNNNWNR